MSLRARIASQVFLVLAITAAIASAQDTIGIWWDEGYSSNEAQTSAPHEQLTGHLVISEPSAGGGLFAWECEVTVEGPGLILGWDLVGQVINAESPPRFVVGLASPLPPASQTRVATFDMLVTEVAPVEIGLRPLFQASVPGRMSYIGADDPETLVPLSTSTGTEAVAFVNPDIPIAGYDLLAIRFGEVILGTTVAGSVQVTNVGGGLLALDPQLDCPGAGFSLAGTGGPRQLAGGESWEIVVEFTPTTTGPAACVLQPGAGLDPIPLIATVREPITSWEGPADIQFGTVPYGQVLTKATHVTNTGETTLAIDVTLEASCQGFTILDGGGPDTIPPGVTRHVRVRFAPQEPGTWNCDLSFGLQYETASVTGTAREPIGSWEGPTDVAFGPVSVGAVVQKTATLLNTGETTLSLDIAMVAPCAEFVVVAGDGLHQLAPGANHTVTVRFNPQETGTWACDLDFGDPFGTSRVSGYSHWGTAQFEIMPPVVAFGPTDVGQTSVQQISVTNTGTNRFEFRPDIVADEPVFDLNHRGELIRLDRDQTVLLEVSFTPSAEQYFAGSLELGGPLPEVPLSGVGGPLVFGCSVSTDSLVLDVLAPGSAASRVVVVQNTGSAPLDFAPAVDRPEFDLLVDETGPITPGAARSVMVTFTAASFDTVRATLDLGDDICAPVHLIGGVELGIQPGQNQVGFFWDEDYSIIETGFEPSGADIPVFLALINPSNTSGVAGWECQVRIGGQAEFTHVELAGNAINAGDPNVEGEFAVGIGLEPLPYRPDGILLATFSLLVTDPDPENVNLQLHPLYHASLPGHMAWVPWDDSQALAPMLTTTGMPEVAWINTGMPVAIETPTPRATQFAGQVELSWTSHRSDVDGYHVQRQGPDGRNERLTAGALPATERMTYVDTPPFAPGAQVFYSYVAVLGERTIAVSPAVAVELAAMTPAASRLLSNVPNPFNPETRIRYHVGRSGQVRIAVHDVTGRRVRTLVDSRQEIGPQEVVWRGRDDAGLPVASGTYYVRMETGDGVDHRKVMMLK